MAVKPEDPGMWINPKSNMHGASRQARYGEGQNSHNSRYLELADVALAPKKLKQPKAAAKAADETPTKH
ncbi:MAG TPA: hypothetical protein VGK22_06890 [Candidatus Angelobacter sp.]